MEGIVRPQMSRIFTWHQDCVKASCLPHTKRDFSFTCRTVRQPDGQVPCKTCAVDGKNCIFSNPLPSNSGANLNWLVNCSMVVAGRTKYAVVEYHCDADHCRYPSRSGQSLHSDRSEEHTSEL